MRSGSRPFPLVVPVVPVEDHDGVVFDKAEEEQLCVYIIFNGLVRIEMVLGDIRKDHRIEAEGVESSEMQRLAGRLEDGTVAPRVAKTPKIRIHTVRVRTGIADRFVEGGAADAVRADIAALLLPQHFRQDRRDCRLAVCPGDRGDVHFAFRVIIERRRDMRHGGIRILHVNDGHGNVNGPACHDRRGAAGYGVLCEVVTVRRRSLCADKKVARPDVAAVDTQVSDLRILTAVREKIPQPFGLHFLISVPLFHKLIDGPVHAADGFFVMLLDRFDDAVLHVFLEEHTSGAAELRAHGGKLDQDVGAVFAALDHPLDRLEMPDRTGEAVDDPFDVCRIMGMCMDVPFRVDVGVSIHVAMLVHMRMFAGMFAAVAHEDLPSYCTCFFSFFGAGAGMAQRP